MATDTIAEINMVVEHCCNCGIPFAMTKDFKDSRLQDGKNFCCPNGHEQHYTKPKKREREIEQLKKERDRYKNRMYHYKEEAEHKEYQKRGYKGALTRQKNAIARGECPSCGDKFEDLKNHMEEKHPDMQIEDPEPVN